MDSMTKVKRFMSSMFDQYETGHPSACGGWWLFSFTGRPSGAATVPF
jgi:hypothetical protein